MFNFLYIVCIRLTSLVESTITSACPGLPSLPTLPHICKYSVWDFGTFISNTVSSQVKSIPLMVASVTTITSIEPTTKNKKILCYNTVAKHINTSCRGDITQKTVCILCTLSNKINIQYWRCVLINGVINGSAYYCKVHVL